MESVTRYVCTYINSEGERTLIGPAQGRLTYATREEAETHLAAIMGNNTAKTIAEVYGSNPQPEVRPCPCYPGHFDPQTIWFEE
jgi:hypothetical protein